MGLNITVHRQLQSLPSEAWDALPRAGQGVLRLGVLGPCETALSGLSWSLMTAHRGSALEGIAAGYQQATHWASIAPAAFKAPLAFVAPLKVLELGPPVCPGPPAVVSSRPTWNSLLEAALAQVEHQQMDLLAVRDFAGPLQSEEETQLGARGFSKVSSRDTWVLALPFDSFEGYLGALRADYRRRARAVLERPRRVSIIRDFGFRAPEIARLIELTAARSQSSRLERIDVPLLAAWALEPRTAALLVEDVSGELLATAVVLSDGPVVHFLRCGFEEAVGRTTGAYLRLLFELVRFAIDEGAQFLDLGVTSGEPKQRLGAQAVQLRVWARPRRAAFRKALRLLSPALVSEHSPSSRHVFRNRPPPINPWWYQLVTERGGEPPSLPVPSAEPSRPTAR